MQVLWECLQILRVTGPAVHQSLVSSTLSLLPGLVGCCWHEHSGVHSAAAACAEALASARSGAVLPPLLRLGCRSHATPALASATYSAVAVSGLPSHQKAATCHIIS